MPVALLVTLAAVALALDLVDGWLARRTETASALGARFDGEVDAFLILALSVYVARALGAWVLAIGAARYLFLAGEWLLPWMRAPLPPRRWRKLVAAMQGVVLTVAAADVVPRRLMHAAPAVALALLAASISECVWWLWRRRDAFLGARGRPRAARPRPVAHGPRRRRLTVLAVVVVWLRARRAGPAERCLARRRVRAAAPRSSSSSSALAACVLPAVPRRVLAVVAGTVLAVLVVVKVLDMGFITAFDRPFDPVVDLEPRGGSASRRCATRSAGRPRTSPSTPSVVLVVGLLAAPVLGAAARHARRRPATAAGRSRRAARARRRLGGACASSARRSPPRAPPPSPSARCTRCAAACRRAADPRPRRSPATASAPLPATSC